MQLEEAFEEAKEKAKSENVLYAVYWSNNMGDFWLVAPKSEFPWGFYGYIVHPDGKIHVTD